MNIKIIVQVNNETGEKRVHFTQDFMTPTEDFLVNWQDSKVIESPCVLIANKAEVEDLLLNTEFTSVLRRDEPVFVQTGDFDNSAILQEYDSELNYLAQEDPQKFWQRAAEIARNSHETI
jgi:hypothetical protein